MSSRGMHLSVYRSDFCSTNGPTSGAITSITLVGQGVPEIFEASERAPAMYLSERRDGTPILVPEENPSPMQYMAGGNFAWSCDSRFRDLVRELTGSSYDGPIAIFDRDESKMKNEPCVRYYRGKLEFRSGEVEWSHAFVFTVNGSVHEEAAMDFIAANSCETPDRYGDSSWLNKKGDILVTPKVFRQINRQVFETLAENGVERHDITQESYNEWAVTRGDLDAMVIYSPNEAAMSCGDGYWSNEDGWGGLESATRYNRSESAMIRPHRMPVATGGDARFVPVAQ